MSANTSLGRPILWNLTGNAVSFISSFATAVIVARLLGPVEMGKFAVAIALMALLQSAFFLGTTNFVVRERDVGRELIGSVFSLALAQGLLVGGLILALAYPVAAFQRVDEVERILYILAFVPMLMPFEGVALAFVMRAMRFDLVMIITVVKSVVQCAASLGLAFAGYGVFSLAWGLLAACAIAAVLGLAILSCQVGIALNLRHWRRMLRFSVQAMLVTSLTTANARLPEFLLGRLAGLRDVGLFARAAATADMARRAVVNPTSQVLFPRLSQAHRAGDELAERTLDFNARCGTFFVPLFALLAVLAGPVIVTLYGTEWSLAGPPLAALSLSAGIAILCSGMPEALILLDRQSLIIRLELTRTVVGLLMVLAAAPFGLWAVALTRCVDSAFAVSLYCWALARLDLLDLRAWTRSLGQSLALAAITALPCLFVIASAIPDAAPWVQIAAAAPVAAICFVGGGLAMRNGFVRDLCQLAIRVLAMRKVKLS